MPRMWFRAKRYGWGWTPVTIEGWLVIAGFVAVILASTVAFVHRTRAAAGVGIATILFAVWILLLTGALVTICWMTGERPRWRWGKD